MTRSAPVSIAPSMLASPRSARLYWPAVATLVLVTVGDFQIRSRPVDAALDSSIDLVVMLEIGAYAAVGAFVVGVVARPSRARRPSLVLAAAWAWVIVLAVSALWAPSPVLATVRAGQLVVAMVLAHTIASRAQRRDLVLIAHGFVLAVTAWIAVGVAYRRPPPLVADRFTWLYTHPVVAGSLLVVSVLILASWLGRGGGPRLLSPTVTKALLVVHVVALAATQTRGSMLAVLVGLGLLVWRRTGRRRHVDLTVLAALALPVVVVAGRGVLESIVLRGEGVDQLRSLNSRTALWSQALEELDGHALFGRGYFASREIFLDTIGLGGAHNVYIDVAVSAGLVGLTAFVALIAITTIELVRRRDDPHQPLLAAVFLAMLVNGVSVGYAAQAGTGMNVVFLVILGWLAAIGPHGRAAARQ